MPPPRTGGPRALGKHASTSSEMRRSMRRRLAGSSGSRTRRRARSMNRRIDLRSSTACSVHGAWINRGCGAAPRHGSGSGQRRPTDALLDLADGTLTDCTSVRGRGTPCRARSPRAARAEPDAARAAPMWLRSGAADSMILLMSIAHHRRFRALIAGPLMAITWVTAAAAPLLERADIPHAAAIESHHDPAKCPPPHDHRLCTQAGANHSVVPARSDTWHPTHSTWVTLPAAPRTVRTSAAVLPAPARAPPAS